MQYDVTWDMARNQDLAEPAGAWVREKFIPELDRRMAADGHLVAPYGALRSVNGTARVLHGSIFAALFAPVRRGCRTVPSLLVETHSLKAARTRAWANYDIMRHAIDTILLDPEGCARRCARRTARWRRTQGTGRRRRCTWRAK